MTIIFKVPDNFCRAAVANKPNGVNLANISSTSMDLTFTFNLKGHFSPRFTLSRVPFSLLLQQTTYSRKQMLLKKVSCSTSKEEGHVLLNYDGRGQGSHCLAEVWRSLMTRGMSFVSRPVMFWHSSERECHTKSNLFSDPNEGILREILCIHSLVSKFLGDGQNRQRKKKNENKNTTLDKDSMDSATLVAVFQQDFNLKVSKAKAIGFAKKIRDSGLYTTHVYVLHMYVYMFNKNMFFFTSTWEGIATKTPTNTLHPQLPRQEPQLPGTRHRRQHSHTYQRRQRECPE